LSNFCFFKLKEHLDNYTDVRKLISKIYEGKNQTKRIKKTKITQGLVEFELASGLDTSEFYSFLFLDVQLRTYYDFIYNVIMPKAEGLTLKDCLILFSMIQSIFKNVANYNKVEDDSVMRIKEFGKFPSKIKSNHLKLYLKSKTRYSTKQINYFINLLVNKKDQRLNFWNYPLLEKNGFYYVPLLSFLDPLIFVLSDKWLEDSGFDLEERGSYFEKNIKENFTEALTNKKYNFIIPNISKYTLPDGKFEEIDLIMNLKNVVVIAEVKCIKYSLTPRDEFNALKRLREGAKQINRKAEFIVNDSEKFKNEIGDITGKKIIKIVLTNFPSYSGYILEDVPIVDYYLIESYIKSGRISSYRYVTENGKITENKLRAEEIFYNNEDEFCNKFESFVLKPDYIEKCRDYFEFKVNKLSVENDTYNIYSDSVEFKTE
jgi:Holliday junction resolvase-like predicted endonuclease